ncbi:MAG: alpha-1,2-fucosyltransferase, partial [Streptococcaceae bacterium]|nr:alpha-1,2-fucosyltransferase [Streptococcaceae bacterium]
EDALQGKFLHGQLEYFKASEHYQKLLESESKFILKRHSILQSILIFSNAIFRKTIFKNSSVSKYEELTGSAKKYADFLYKNHVWMYPFEVKSYFDLSNNAKSVFFRDFFENPKYFKDFQAELIDDLTPLKPILKQNELLFKKMAETQSVCITIRRGDFLSDKYKSAHFLTDDAYFVKGIAAIKEVVDNPVFFVFSDDLEYAAEFTQKFLKDDEFFVETPDNPVWEKLRLGSACKHFIISNSTFSWWLQFLGSYENKKVVGPNIWKPNTKYDNPLIQDDWIKIKMDS